jgi:WD40 repeat protein
MPNRFITKFPAHHEEFTAMVFNPSGDVLATAGADKLVKLWNI